MQIETERPVRRAQRDLVVQLHVLASPFVASGWLETQTEQHRNRFGNVFHADHHVDVFVLPER